MEKIDELAKQNDQSILLQYNAVLENCLAKNSLEKFINYLKENLSVSINMRLHSLFSFLQEERYKNMYELYSDSELEKQAQFTQRLSFDTSFTNGTTFKYGALNSGNIGTYFWGEFCVSFDKSKMGSVVLIKHNSLSKESNGKYRYFSQNNELLLDKLKNDMATYGQSIPLVTYKNKDQKFESMTVDDYNECVCEGEMEYIEAILEFNLTLEFVSFVTLKYEVFDKILNNGMDNKTSKDKTNEQIILGKLLKGFENKKIEVRYFE